MKKKMLKVIIFLFLIMILNIIFSIKLYALEVDVQTTERAAVVGKEFFIRVKIKYDTSHDAYVEWYGDEKEEYIESLGGSFDDGEDPVTKEVSHKDGVWILELGFKAKKVGQADIKIISYTKGKVLGLEKDRKEKTIHMTVMHDIETAYQEEPTKDADAQTIKYFILSDYQYNDSKNLKQIAQRDMDKIKQWRETIGDLIASDRHYAGQNQYGAVRDVLDDIIEASESGQSTDQAIEESSTGLDSTVDLTTESTERVTVGVATSVEGEERETVEFTDVLSDMENYIPGEEDIPTEFISKANIILTVVTTVGMIVSVLIIAVLGIKYMLGSVEEKADYKKDMIPYLIGAVLTFGITSIVKILQQIGESFN